jgi:hypothetical protein
MIDLFCKMCDGFVLSLPADEAEYLTVKCSSCWE